MGFTNKEDNLGIYARILLKDSLGFQVGKKVGDERENKLYDSVSGEFVSISKGSYKTEEGEERETVRIQLWDDQTGLITISTAWTGVARNIVNSLSGEIELGTVSLGLYKKIAKDGKSYANVWVKNNGNQTKWKYSIEDQDKLITKTEFKGKVMRDFEKLEEALKGEFESINKKSQHKDITPLEKNPDTEIEKDDSADQMPF
jgi:hypothetical protein